MALLLAIANQKGGCGKTTTTMNVAGGLQKAGYRVAVVDADPQASSVAWSIAQGGDSLPFDVIPGRQIKTPQSLAGSADYDVVLFDCPPGMADSQATNTLSETQKLARTAVRIADAILVPLRPSTLDFTAAAPFVRYLAHQLDPHQKVLVLVNGTQKTQLSKQAPAQAAVLFSAIPQAVVLQSQIGLRIAIAEVSGSGATIFDYAPGQEAAREYTNLTKEIIQCLVSAQPSISSRTSQAHTSPSRRAA